MLGLLERCLSLNPRDRPSIDDIMRLPMLSSISRRLEDPAEQRTLQKEWRKIVAHLSQVHSDRIVDAGASARQTEGFFSEELVQLRGGLASLNYYPAMGQHPTPTPIFRAVAQPRGGVRPPFAPNRSGPARIVAPQAS